MVLKVGYIVSRKKNNPNIQQTVLVHVDFEIHVYYQTQKRVKNIKNKYYVRLVLELLEICLIATKLFSCLFIFFDLKNSLSKNYVMPKVMIQ